MVRPLSAARRYLGRWGLIVALAFAWGMKRPTHMASDAAHDAQDVERVVRAEGLATLPKDYSAVPKLGAPAGEFRSRF